MLERWHEERRDDFVRLASDSRVMRFIGDGSTWVAQRAQAVFIDPITRPTCSGPYVLAGSWTIPRPTPKPDLAVGAETRLTWDERTLAPRESLIRSSCHGGLGVEAAGGIFPHPQLCQAHMIAQIVTLREVIHQSSSVLRERRHPLNGMDPVLLEDLSRREQAVERAQITLVVRPDERTNNVLGAPHVTSRGRSPNGPRAQHGHHDSERRQPPHSTEIRQHRNVSSVRDVNAEPSVGPAPSKLRVHEVDRPATSATTLWRGMRGSYMASRTTADSEAAGVLYKAREPPQAADPARLREGSRCSCENAPARRAAPR